MNPIIVSVASQREFARRLANQMSSLFVSARAEDYPNGELHLAVPGPAAKKLLDATEGTHILVGSTDHRDIAETVGLGTFLTRRPGGSFTLIIPYFRTSTQERWKKDKGENEEIALGQIMVNLLNGIPRGDTRRNNIILCDLHDDSLASRFDPDRWNVHHVSLLEHVLGAVGEEEGPRGRGFTHVMNPDGGREHFVARAASILRVDQCGVQKTRLSGLEVHHGKISGEHLQRAKVLMLDDMIRSGSTAIGAAKKLREAGAHKVTLAAVHGDFSTQGLRAIVDSGLFTNLVVTDTWPQAEKSIAGLSTSSTHVSLTRTDRFFARMLTDLLR